MKLMAEQVAKALKLEPHLNGGWFRELHRDEAKIPRQVLPSNFGDGDTDDRSISTAIIVLLLGGKNFSALHKVHSDETYHYYMGTKSITLYEFDIGTKAVKEVRMGHDVMNDELLQYTIKKETVWGTKVNSDNEEDYAVFGATVAPGFDFRDFTLPTRNEMQKIFPNHKDLIKSLTRE